MNLGVYSLQLSSSVALKLEILSAKSVSNRYDFHLLSLLDVGSSNNSISCSLLILNHFTFKILPILASLRIPVITVIIQALLLLKSEKVGICIDRAQFLISSFPLISAKNIKCIAPWSYVAACLFPSTIKI